MLKGFVKHGHISEVLFCLNPPISVKTSDEINSKCNEALFIGAFLTGELMTV